MPRKLKTFVVDSHLACYFAHERSCYTKRRQCGMHLILPSTVSLGKQFHILTTRSVKKDDVALLRSVGHLPAGRPPPIFLLATTT